MKEEIIAKKVNIKRKTRKKRNDEREGTKKEKGSLGI